MVAHIDWTRFVAQFGGAVPGLYAQLYAASAAPAYSVQLMALPAQQRAQALGDYLRQSLASAFGFGNPQRIKGRDRFFDLGLDSLLALELTARLEKDLGCRLGTTLMFDYPTYDALLAHLEQAVLGSAEADVAADALPAQESELDAMSADEMDLMLEDKLARLDAYLNDAS
jgi:acyl carrier protein